MEDVVEVLGRAAPIGIGATVLMDFWMHVRRRLFGTAPPDYAMVGRWIGHMGRGKFVHRSIAKASPIPAERALGWTIHYATGIAFAVLLLGVAGPGWATRPSLAPALSVGLATLAAPFLLMQPGMGAGIAARRAPRPRAARLQSLVTHAIFGLGLFLSAWLVNLVSTI